MRQGRVFCNGIAAGIITEDEQGYTFVYDEAYLSMQNPKMLHLKFVLPTIFAFQLFKYGYVAD